MDAATITALCTGIVTIIAAIFAGLTSLKNGKKIDVVQTAVNGNTAVREQRVAQLQETLIANDVPIPPTPAPPIEEPPHVV